MTYVLYALCGLLLVVFLVLAGFSVYHSFHHAYLSPRVRPVTWAFIIASSVLIAVGLFLVFRVEL